MFCEKSIHIWRKNTLVCSVPTEHNVYALDYTPDGSRIAFGDEEGYVGILDVAALQTTEQRISSEAIYAVKVSPDGKFIAAAGADNRIHILSPQLERVQELRMSKSPITCLTWSPDGTYIAAGNVVGNTFVVPLENPLAYRPLSAKGEVVAIVCWTANNLLRVSMLSGEVHIHEMPSGFMHVSHGRLYGSNSFALSPDGIHVASSIPSLPEALHEFKSGNVNIVHKAVYVYEQRISRRKRDGHVSD